MLKENRKESSLACTRVKTTFYNIFLEEAQKRLGITLQA